MLTLRNEQEEKQSTLTQQHQHVLILFGRYLVRISVINYLQRKYYQFRSSMAGSIIKPATAILPPCFPIPHT
jgi:hypothetical protein